IPAAMTKQVLTAALGGSDTVVRPWLGARTQTITGEIARSLGMAAPRGVLVADVWQGGAAARAGLRDGDVIVSVAGQPVNDEGALTYQFGARRIGETVPVTVLRDGRETTLNVRAEAAPRTPAADERTISGRNPLSGATVVNLSPAAADELGIDPFTGPGVLVTRVGAGFARDAGFQPGDMISQVNGRNIRDVRDLASVLSANTRIWRVTVQRGGRAITADFRT
ncbi:MAG TPA: PDZ domain-containing protein, partial [Caulobacteraceae bacterium]